ncbi:efflux RND transporter periplasmic adaptor subunit [Litorivivens sp.]|uniref:efflux RND transporter periplasmic adaptor subunit n=1 Tax=Litorivivens sp. TaxID=2020868 RepID=UPI00356907EE
MSNQRLKSLLPAAILIGAMGAATIIATARSAPEPTPPPAPPPPRVDTITMIPATAVLQVRAQGTVAPRRQIDLAAQVGGRIVHASPYYAPGGTFAKDETLIQIEAADYEIAVVRAKARVAEARQNLATERGRGRQAKREWRDLGSAEANDLFLRKPQLAAAEAQLAAAEGELRQAELNLTRTEIKAPFAGRILSINANLGQYVNAGSAVASVYDAEVVEIALPLSERQLGLLDLPLGDHLELPVTVHATLGQKSWQRLGVITRTAASIDEQTRFAHAIAEVRNPSGSEALAIGQFVSVDIPSRPLENVLTLPENLIHPRNTLWVVDEQNRLQLHTVTVLQAINGKVAIQADSSNPLRIVTSYLARPLDGMELAPNPDQAQSGALL